MFIRRALFSAAAGLALLHVSLPARAVEISLLEAPNASLRYRGEGKALPQSYVNRADGMTSPVYRVEMTQTPARSGYWGMSLWHTGVFGGGTYATETIPDETTGGTYQTNLLNVGFTNFFVTYHRAVADWPVEMRAHVSVARQIFKRTQITVQGVTVTGMDDVNEISAEGLGLGLSGRHGGKVYFRWAADAHYYVQLFDAETDASAGQIFQGEGAVGTPLGRFDLEAGALWQYWFILGQGNRRLTVPGTDGAVISWNRQLTIAQGFFLRLAYKFD